MRATYMKVPRLLMERAITDRFQYLHLVARAFTLRMRPRRENRRHELVQKQTSEPP